MYNISMCVIQVNKVDLKPTTYYTLTPRNNLKNLSFIQESKKEYPSHAAVATATATATRRENPQFTAITIAITTAAATATQHFQPYLGGIPLPHCEVLHSNGTRSCNL